MTENESLYRLLLDEITEKTEEGCDVSSFAEMAQNSKGDAEKLCAVFDELERVSVKPDFPYAEPDELAEIRKLSPCGFEQRGKRIAKNRFYGAWLGRCIGCALGKPLERDPYGAGRGGKGGWYYVYEWFKQADAYPIGGYVPEHSRAEQTLGLQLSLGSRESLREYIRYMQTDDDVRYMVLALIILEKFGFGFTTRDVMNTWLDVLPINQTFTAERCAYLNAASAPEKGMEYIRRHRNPYREWIGAQIRVDVYAYAAAGDPSFAAELAFRDAVLSHTKNGVYGAMFCAAIIAAAFTEKDPRRIVDAGLSQIPKNSRLAEAVRKAVFIAERANTETELAQNIWEAFGSYHPVHTINNAALCAAAVVFGKGDFDKSVSAAVLGGWDTDCNGATVGSVMGAMLGAEGIPEKWKVPLHDTLYSSIPDFHPIKISECANRSFDLWNAGHKEL